MTVRQTLRPWKDEGRFPRALRAVFTRVAAEDATIVSVDPRRLPCAEHARASDQGATTA